MTTRTDNLSVPQGTTCKYQWPIRDADGQTVSLTDYTARSQVRKRTPDAEVLAEWTTENAGIVLADSSLTLIIEPAQSSAWDWVSGRYDIELESPEGSVTRITQGSITVDREVTR